MQLLFCKPLCRSVLELPKELHNANRFIVLFSILVHWPWDELQNFIHSLDLHSGIKNTKTQLFLKHLITDGKTAFISLSVSVYFYSDGASYLKKIKQTLLV